LRVLITGGAGFIGSHIVDAHIEKGDDVLIIDNLSTGFEENINKKASFEKIDIIDDLHNIFESFRPQIVNHHAAQINVRRSEKDPIYDARNNIIGTINLLLLAKKYQVEHFIFASSGGTVYGEAEILPTAEDYHLNPLSPYGCSKVAGEFYIRSLLKDSGIKYTVLRYGNIYGPRQNPLSEAGVIVIFITSILKGEVCTIFGDGEQTRDYLHVYDCVAANLLALDHPPGIYNIGTGIETSVNQLIEILKEIVGRDFEYQHGPPRPEEIRKSCLDWKRAREVLNWRPRTSLRSGIAETYRYYSSI